jgi:catechol 2,3-dioxygenase-like lactoylglutathione lyase family enzyme
MTATLRCEKFPSDLDATIAFYSAVLGFDLVRDNRGSASPYVALARGEVLIGAAARREIVDRSQRRPVVGVELVLEVDDLEADRARVAAAGWPIEEDVSDRPWGLRDFRLLDPSGYYWRITNRGT